MKKMKFNTVVIGSGPAGYVAGIRLGQLGIKAAVIERENPGGVCLNWGCIPSKVLISGARKYWEVLKGKKYGIKLDGELSLDLEILQKYKNKVVKKLSRGVTQLLKANNTKLLSGEAVFIDEHHLLVENDKEKLEVEFENCLIATGSKPATLPFIDMNNPDIIGSKEALALESPPEKLVIIGGGVIGLELGQFYAMADSKVIIIEAESQVLPGVEPQLVKVLTKKLKKMKIEINNSSLVEKVENSSAGLEVQFKQGDNKKIVNCSKVLVTVGRTPFFPQAEKLGLKTKNGFIVVDEYCRTNLEHIYAAGDVAGNPLLAHKASAQAEVAVDNIAGKARKFQPAAIPAVCYTWPEIATVGLSEQEARQKGQDIKTGQISFKSSGRAMASTNTEGFIKLISDNNDVLLGAEIVSSEASELIHEAALAIENKLGARALGETIHAHPTLGESMMEAARDLYGEAVHKI
ncbi:MAG: dihydrolipoyl dehydrogenase [Deltaproteobacteria bacterium]|jgi:dihydrolipoamide dehydrogenase|nr:dihydrolipoyl dehydrogenase [Deltaproteobacteria bacterium]